MDVYTSRSHSRRVFTAFERLLHLRGFIRAVWTKAEMEGNSPESVKTLVDDINENVANILDVLRKEMAAPISRQTKRNINRNDPPGWESPNGSPDKHKTPSAQMNIGKTLEHEPISTHGPNKNAGSIFEEASGKLPQRQKQPSERLEEKNSGIFTLPPSAQLKRDRLNEIEARLMEAPASRKRGLATTERDFSQNGKLELTAGGKFKWVGQTSSSSQQQQQQQLDPTPEASIPEDTEAVYSPQGSIPPPPPPPAVLHLSSMNSLKRAAAMSVPLPVGVSATPSLKADGKKLQCRWCDKRFRQKSNLKSHERTHSGEKPYGCDLCGRHFSHLSNMKRHKQVHNNNSNSSNPRSKDIKPSSQAIGNQRKRARNTYYY
mmetsp:Transcript_9038/g.14410  ORF Transcript_9038/g.14410 Transcript_9038/m.14410 type:complete len:375 (+) Transcript_9038:120-1244(+)